MNERLLTVAQAADALSLNIQTVRKWLRTGKLRGLRTGDARLGRNEWRVPESAIGEALRPPHASATTLSVVAFASPDASEEEVAEALTEIRAQRAA